MNLEESSKKQQKPSVKPGTKLILLIPTQKKERKGKPLKLEEPFSRQKQKDSQFLMHLDIRTMFQI